MMFFVHFLNQLNIFNSEIHTKGYLWQFTFFRSGYGIYSESLSLLLPGWHKTAFKTVINMEWKAVKHT